MISQYQTLFPVEKGWSGDKKLCVSDENGRKYLLRISGKETLEKKKTEFANMQALHSLGLRMCAPVEMFETEEGVACVHEWIEGRDAENVIPSLPESKQYAYGLDAGRMLKIIHSIKAPEELPGWEARYQKKIDRKLEMYNACPIKYGGSEAALHFVCDNRHIVKERPQCFHHGDYHTGNMMIDTNGQLVIIDFNRADYGDPYEEFNRIVWCAQLSGAFASGLLDGYFDGSVPEEFFRILALYIAVNSLSSLPWAIPFGEEEIEVMKKQAGEILVWYDSFTRTVPSWYRKYGE